MTRYAKIHGGHDPLGFAKLIGQVGEISSKRFATSTFTKLYLTNRYQRTIVDHLKSNEKLVSCVVSQIYTLRSFLFFVHNPTRS